MNKPAALLGLLVLFALPAVAQENPPAAPPATEAPSDQKPAKHVVRYTPKIELSGGYTYRKFYFPGGQTLGMHGWYGSVDYNIYHWLGAYVEISGAYKDRGGLGNSSVYTFVAGPRIYPLGHRKLTPFAHALAGEGYYRNVVPNVPGFNGFTTTHTGLAWQAGGGVDWNIRKHLGIRLFEADYGPIKFFGSNIDKGSGRVSVGIVYRFGEK